MSAFVGAGSKKETSETAQGTPAPGTAVTPEGSERLSEKEETDEMLKVRTPFPFFFRVCQIMTLTLSHSLQSVGIDANPRGVVITDKGPQ